MLTNKPLIIYHANCMDGFTAAWCAWRLYGDEGAEYVPMSYGDDIALSRLKDRVVHILDFSFSRERLTEMAACAEELVVLDHHKTAQEALEGWEDAPKNLILTFDMQRSGAGIAWDFYFYEAKPLLVQYVQDRDLWKFEYWKSKEINAYIAMQPRSFDCWERLHRELDESLQFAVNIGAYLLAQHSKTCEQIVEQTARPFSIEDSQGTTHHGLSCNCTGSFASDVGNLLATRTGSFGATWFTDSEGNIKWSLRSVGDFDVAAIAKTYGGGGHRNAAGFSLRCPEESKNGIVIWHGKDE